MKAGLIAAGTTADDQIFVGIHRILANQDRRRRDEAESEEDKRKRQANRRRAERRWERKTQPRTHPAAVRSEPEEEDLDEPVAVDLAEAA